MVEDMTRDPESSRMHLLKQLRGNSEFLETLKEEISDIWTSELKTVSFYETIKTSTVAKVALATSSLIEPLFINCPVLVCIQQVREIRPRKEDGHIRLCSFISSKRKPNTRGEKPYRYGEIRFKARSNL
jgi:hypothetical protein